MARTEVPAPVSRRSWPPPCKDCRQSLTCSGKNGRECADADYNLFEDMKREPLYKVTNITDGDIVFQDLDFLKVKSGDSLIIYNDSPLKILKIMSEAVKTCHVKIESLPELETISKMVVVVKPSDKNKYKFISEA